MSDQEPNPVIRHRGIQPGGGFLVVYQFPLDSFGALGTPKVRALSAEVRANRKGAFKAIRRLLAHYDMLEAHAEILSIGIGNDALGHQSIVVVCTKKVVGIEE